MIRPGEVPMSSSHLGPTERVTFVRGLAASTKMQVPGRYLQPQNQSERPRSLGRYSVAAQWNPITQADLVGLLKRVSG